MDTERFNDKRPWIPAIAGMTGWGDAGDRRILQASSTHPQSLPCPGGEDQDAALRSGSLDAVAALDAKPVDGPPESARYKAGIGL